jgi:hypothetical protein
MAAKAKKAAAKGKAATKKSKGDKPVVLVVWGKVKRLQEIGGKRVSRDVKFVLSDHVTSLMKNAAELAGSDGMETIKDRHVVDAIKALGGAKTEE